MKLGGSVGSQGRTGKSPDFETVVSQLRSMILSGDLKPGERLGQEKLANMIGASRMPIRSALQFLESEGLVTIVPRTGAWVAKLDLQEFEDIYKLREVIEPFAITASIPNLEQHTVDYLEKLLADLDQIVDPSLQLEDFLRLDREFHLESYSGIKNGMLREMVLRLWNTTQQFRRALLTKRSVEQLHVTRNDHALILDAIKRRDSESASKLVWVHIHRTRQDLYA